MTHHPITPAELARRAGVNRSSITRLLQGRLAAALVGKRIDPAHSDVVAWAVDRGLNPASLLTRAAGPALTEGELERIVDMVARRLARRLIAREEQS